jgi:hypothetical protein
MKMFFWFLIRWFFWFLSNLLIYIK